MPTWLLPVQADVVIVSVVQTLPISVICPGPHSQTQPGNHIRAFVGAGPFYIALMPGLGNPSPVQWVECDADTGATVPNPF